MTLTFTRWFTGLDKRDEHQSHLTEPSIIVNQFVRGTVTTTACGNRTRETSEQEREREREADRQTDRETDSQTDRETERQKYRERERERERDIPVVHLLFFLFLVFVFLSFVVFFVCLLVPPLGRVSRGLPVVSTHFFQPRLYRHKGVDTRLPRVHQESQGCCSYRILPSSRTQQQQDEEDKEEALGPHDLAVSFSTVFPNVRCCIQNGTPTKIQYSHRLYYFCFLFLT